MSVEHSPIALEALHRYLPPALQERWRECGWDEIDLPRCVTHLSDLYQTMTTYLPRAIVRGDLWGPAGSGDSRYGTFIFADVSGFTPMSERFSQAEEERGSGSEELTGVVNSYFEVVNGIALSCGGDLLKFGGDAVLGLFMGQDHAARACRAAFEMQAAMAEDFDLVQTSLGSFPLRMNIGVGTGQFFSVSLGSADRLEYAVLGQAVQSMAQAEVLAQAGQVALDQATRDAAASFVQVAPTLLGDGYYELRDADPIDVGSLLTLPTIPQGSPEEKVVWLVSQLQRLEPYLPLGLLDKLRAAPRGLGLESDHRWATTFFAGLHGANQLIEELGAERVNDSAWAFNRYFVAAQGIIERYEGVVNRVGAGKTGLQLHVLFGAPITHEDDPERAVYAALDLQDVLDGVNREVMRELYLEKAPFRQAIGTSTGFVFAGSIGSAQRREYTVMGDIVNLAHRLMSAASAGQVIISAPTAAHLSSRVMVEKLAPISLKGKSEPVPHSLVKGRAGGGVLDTRAHSRMVGREKELGLAEAAAEAVLAGSGRVLVLRGDVGVGKTRLALELGQRMSERGVTVVVGQSVSFLRDTVPYLPWIDALRQLLDVPVGGLPDEQLAALEHGMIEAGLTGWEPLVAEMLGVPAAETPLTSSLDPRLRQQRLFDLVLELIAFHSHRHPLLLWLEDVQWADVASLGLLDYVGRNIRRLPAMLLTTLRPVEHLEGRWQDLDHAIEIEMGELADAARTALVAQLLQVSEVSEQVVQGIVTRAQGNPLFIEEMVQALIDTGVLVREGENWVLTDPQQADVPDSIHGIFQSRIDRLPETERRVLQVASVIGQSFASQVLERVYPYGDLEGVLSSQLRVLSDGQFLLPAPPPADYSFRHAMIQEVAYGSLAHARRRSLHRDIAYLIEGSGEAEFPERLEFVALHFYRGREWEKARSYLLRAGKKAEREYANEAAISHFRRALRALGELDQADVESQLSAYEGLGQVLTLMGKYDEALEYLDQGWGLVEAWPSSPQRDTRLAELCHRMAEAHDPKGDYEAAFEWLERGLGIPGIEDTVEGARLRRFGSGVLYRQGEMGQAREWCTRSLEIAERLGDEEAMAQGHYSMGAILVRQGDFAGAASHCQTSVDLYEKLGNLLGQAQAYNNLAMAYESQSAWGEAVQYYRAASEIVEQIGYAEGQARAATNLGWLYSLQGELDAAIEQYRAALDLVERLGHRYGMALLCMNLGSAFARGGRWDEAAEYLQRSLDLFQEIGAEEFLAELYRHLAEVALGRGHLDQALEHARRSLEYVQAHGIELEEGSTRRVLGSIWRELRELGQAREELELALELALEMENNLEVGQSRLELARLEFVDRNEDTGRRLAQQAAQAFEELGALLDLEEARELLSGGNERERSDRDEG